MLRFKGHCINKNPRPIYRVRIKSYFNVGLPVTNIINYLFYYRFHMRDIFL